MKYIFGAVVLLVGVFGYFHFYGDIVLPENGSAIASADFQEISEHKSVTVIDIRNERELEETGIIEEMDNHKNVYNSEHVTFLENMDKGGVYLFYCRSGKRSLYLKEHLIDLGFEHVYDLEGGITEWADSGFNLVSWK